MMSKERELLKKALDFMLDAGANLNPLFKEINDNLLVQPEQEPLSYEDIRSIVNQLPAEVDLRVGVEFCRIIEKAHGIKREPLRELLTQPEQEPIAYVANASIGFDVSRSPQGMPLVWLGKLEYGDELYRVGKR